MVPYSTVINGILGSRTPSLRIAGLLTDTAGLLIQLVGLLFVAYVLTLTCALLIGSATRAVRRSRRTDGRGTPAGLPRNPSVPAS